MRSLLFFIVILIIPSIANASDTETSYRVKWKESEGKIIYSSVCYNYKKGSIDFRGCRKQALRYFKQKCAGTGEYKFCAATREYKPVI